MAPPPEAAADDENAHNKHLMRCLGFVFAFYKAVLHPQKVNVFFFWSMAMFAVCAAIVATNSAGSTVFFCAIDPRDKDGNEGCTQSCAGLPLLCPKDSECWRQGVNLTIQYNATVATDSLTQVYQEAALDVGCSEVVAGKGAAGPISMIKEIARYEGTGAGLSLTGNTVTDSCRKFHCGVLSNTLQLSDLMSFDGICTNVKDTRTADRATFCPCNEILTYVDFTPTALLDGPTLSESMQAVKLNCPQVIDQMKAICEKPEVRLIYPIWCSLSTTTTTSVSTTSSSTTDSVTSTTASVTTTATSVTTTSLTTTGGPGLIAAIGGAIAGAGGRRLEEEQERLQEQQEDVLTGEGTSSAHSLAQVAGQAGEERKAEGAAHKRRLQEEGSTVASTAAAAAESLPDFKVGDYGACKCYQQCQPGVQTRLVECEAKVCKPPEPQAKQACDCGHCAACNVMPFLGIQLYIFAAQTGLAGACFVFYLHVESQKQEDFIQLSKFQILLGFFYKKTPPLVRFLVIVQMVLVLYLVFSTFVVFFAKDYMGKFNEDCFRSEDMRTTCLVVSFIWVFQVVFGRTSKHVSRKPDWLFAPTRNDSNAVVKYLSKFFRGLGP